MRAGILLLLCVLLSGYLFGIRAASQSAPSPEPSQNVGSSDGASASHHGPTDALVFLVVALLLGVFTHHVLPFTRIPYTNLLLVKPTCFLVQEALSCFSQDCVQHDDKSVTLRNT